MERPLSDLDASIRSCKHERGTSTGVRFLCPRCLEHGVRHFITVPWAGVSQYAAGLWQLQSAPDLAVLTLSPSINCDVPCAWPADWTDEKKAAAEANRCRFHGWVEGGKVRW